MRRICYVRYTSRTSLIAGPCRARQVWYLVSWRACGMFTPDLNRKLLLLADSDGEVVTNPSGGTDIIFRQEALKKEFGAHTSHLVRGPYAQQTCHVERGT